MCHFHSQLIVLPVVSHNIQAELRGAQEFYDKHDKQCILCGVVKHETQKNRIRLIDENEHFITIALYAASFLYETWLVPKHHSSNFETISEIEIQSTTEMLKLTLRKIDVAFGCAPYNYTLQTAPPGKEHSTFIDILTFYHILHLLGVLSFVVAPTSILLFLKKLLSFYAMLKSNSRECTV